MFATEYLDLPALESAGGVVVLPGSKSISNRVLLLAMLSSGQTRIHDLLDSDDTRVMLDAMRKLGCAVTREADGTYSVTGLGARQGQALPVRQATLFLGNAGTAMRPLVAALALLGGDFELSGVPRMHERPIGDLVDALRAMGCAIEDLGQPGYPPLRVGAGQLRLNAPIRVRGDVSSQFLTALLLALPLAASNDIVIEVVGELISKPYVDITLKLLERFGVRVQAQGYERFVISAGSRYESPGDVWVEGDASSASYFIALGGLSTPTYGQKDRENDSDDHFLSIRGVGSASIQGDVLFAQAAALMGARIDMRPNAISVARGAWPLKGIDLDCNHIPDAAMTLAVMALYADAPTVLRNIASWRVKETDRLSAMAAELRKLGAQVEEGADWLRVHPLAPGHWKPASIHTYDDHRIAMCFSLAAFNPDGVAVRIEDPKCVAKTFPEYFETLFSVSQTSAARIPVICIDGPTASGKGTLASLLAQRLGYGYLDSGALYRALGVAAVQNDVALDDEAALEALAADLQVRFVGDRIELRGVDVTDAVRSEAGGMAASKLSALPRVRHALVARQLAFRTLPGLVTDGRDMGTVIFPDAPLKVYLTASAAQRAERRHKQLISKGFSAIIQDIRADLEARDARDSSRSVAPLKPAEDAVLLDNSELSIEESVALVLAWWQRKQGF